ncbi:type I restriction enzyme, S subunit [Trichlorobacter thiogenes]|uniref:Type I restriction enzyme, S subunit n=1 Tax=Trichlorobacter thiogenes TaxID=115783 RepID=A0A1T4KP08_9BACT|nr:restriction endonuclease subunit S [Trichlorobacter thiogenes]SJZ44139.1 type I restriction enzyme, S subunit [Trichlorobacter thiogenes]
MNQAMEFPRYDSYKPANSSWLLEVPGHWKLLPGLAVLKANKDKNVGMIEETVLSLSYGKVIIKPPEKLTGLVPESFETYQIINPNDIIIRPTDLQNDHTSLRTGFAKDRGIITSAYICLRPEPSHNPAFIHYLLHAYDLLKVFYGMGSGLRQNLDYRDFKRLELCIPPRDEQDRIVSFLDQKTAEIDEAVAKKQRLIDLFKEQKTILVNQTVTKGLNPNVPMRDSGVEWIGAVPEHWEVKRLRYLGTTQNGISASAEYFGSGFPFVSYGDVYNNRELPKAVNGLAKSTVHDRDQYSIVKGDVLFTRTSETVEEIGFSSTCMETIENSTFAGFLIRFRPRKGRLFPGYSKYYFSAQLHRSYFVGEMNLVIRASLSQELLKKLPVLIPPYAEQESIFEFLETESAKIDNVIVLQRQLIDSLKEYKMILISEAVTGKIKL